MSASACAGVTPAFSRAMTLLLYMLPKARRSPAVNPIGTYTSAGTLLMIGPRCGNVKPRGMTPTIVKGWRSSRIGASDRGRITARMFAPTARR